MSARFFTFSLIGFTLAWAAFLSALLWLFPSAQAHWPMAVSATALFFLICIALYIAGRKTAQSSNKNAFTGAVFVSVFAKMALSMALLFAYRNLLHPTGKWFVGIFLLCYAAYTIFEVWFLYRMVKGNSQFAIRNS